MHDSIIFQDHSMKILFVCLGNICRSPIAHGILEHQIQNLELDWIVDSAATANYHTSKPPHVLSQQVCQSHGVQIANQRARQISDSDFDYYDVIYTMDEAVHNELLNKYDWHPEHKKLILITNLDSQSLTQGIPDPYYGEQKDFENVFQLLDELCKKIIVIHQ